MKNNKKFISMITSVTIASQLLSVDSFITYAETSNITNTSVQTQVSSLSQNEIILSGVGCQESPEKGGYHKFVIGFNTTDPSNMKIEIKDIVGLYANHPFHPYFKEREYIKIRLIGKDGNEKKVFSLKGNDNVTVITNELNDYKFEYGDLLQISHAEAGWRTKITGNVIGATAEDFSEKVSKDVLENYTFELTKSGLKQVSNKTRNEITIEGVECQGGTHAFNISFDKINEVLKVKSIAGRDHEINPYFKGKEYVKIQVIKGDGVEVKSVTINGEDPVSKAEGLDGCEFKNGYGLRISHAQAGQNVRVSGYVDYCAANLNKGIDKERLEKVTFREGLNGLYYEEARTYPYEILLKGVLCTEGMHQFKLKFNTRDKKIRVTDTIGRHAFHEYFRDNDYIRLKLTSEDGKQVKKEVTLKGNQHLSEVVKVFDNLSFEYGDLLQIYHAEGGQRFQLISAYGPVKNQSKGLHTYRIDEKDLIPVDNNLIINNK